MPLTATVLESLTVNIGIPLAQRIPRDCMLWLWLLSITTHPTYTSEDAQVLSNNPKYYQDFESLHYNKHLQEDQFGRMALLLPETYTFGGVEEKGNPTEKGCWSSHLANVGVFHGKFSETLKLAMINCILQ